MHRPSLFVLSTLLLAACSSPAETAWPLPDADSRPTVLYFGRYVTPEPESNPIRPPERFEGYHSGLDFEIDEEEADSEVPVMAICDGTIVASGFTEGYGGLIRQHCTLNGERVTVLYGHLQIDSLVKEQTQATKGQRIGVLAATRTQDSGDNRKHLHLGIARGWGSELRGYVQTEQELSLFLNPAEVLPGELQKSGGTFDVIQ